MANGVKYKSEFKYNHILMVILSLISIILIYSLCIIYPMQADDWGYSFIHVFNCSLTERVSSIKDILISQYEHYFVWGGRVVVHVIAQFLLMLGKSWSSIIIALAYTLFIYLLCIYSGVKGCKKVVLFIFCFLFMWLFIPYFSNVILWITGASNYLFGSLIILFFLYPYYKSYKGEKVKIEKALIFIIPFLGLIAGWCNENSSAAAIAIIFLYFVYMKFKKIPIKAWMYVGFIMSIIGYLFMILAPGNQSRFLGQGEDQLIETMSILELILYRLGVLYSHFLKSNVLILTLFYFGVIALFWKIDTSAKKKIYMLDTLIIVSVAYIAFLVMIASPSFPERALFFTNSLLILASGMIWIRIEFVSKLLKIGNYLFILLFCAWFFVDYYWKYETIDNYNKKWEARNEYVKSKKEAGYKDIVLTKSVGEIHPKYGFRWLELTENPDNWINARYARYYGVNSVRLIVEKDLKQ